MKYIYLTTLLVLFNCSSEETKEIIPLSDTSYEVKFAPCVCKREDLVVHAKKTIVMQGVKDYEEFTSKDVEPELESKIIEEDYDNFLYDFSLDTKPKNDLETGRDIITANGKVKQEEINQFVEKNPKSSPPRVSDINSEYRSRGLEVIKGFKSDRKKRHTADEIGKSRPITLYEIRRR
ncbi:MAG TPA: hypothetical protein PLX69_07870 [Leptospiraceae bacterium]|nr:hypothetical protein [Leptospiraceae bacterium]